MADMALFIGWGEPVRGREARAVQVFGEALAYYQRLQDSGEIESYEPALLEVHGGDLGGFVLLRGEADKLLRVWQSEEFQSMTARTRQIVDGLGVTPARIGAGIQEGLAQYLQQAGELA